MECEIKLAVNATGATQITKSPVLREHAVSKPEERDHVDQYFDTPDFTLWKHGFALRVRTDGNHHVQTLKGGGSALAGLHRRTELEADVPTDQPDPELFARQLHQVLPDLAHKLGAKLGDGHHIQLEPVFVNRTKRTSWLIALPDGGGQVECALDIGELQRGDHAVPVRELELEMKSGDPAMLYDLARQVHEATPVRIENISKAERGYAMAAEAAKPQAVKAAPVKLGRKASMGEALAEIVRNCLQQMQANERGVLTGGVESLHQMRVGLRRLRAALAMVRDMVQLPEPMAADIEWLAAELGDARNWDVFIDTLLPALPLADEHQPAMERVRVAAREEAERHRSRVRGAVNSPRYTTLMLALGGWIAGRGWQQPGLPSEPLDQRVAKAAPQLVQHAAARVRKRARQLDLSRPECLHKVRIAAKKERYAREFFATLGHGKRGARRHELLSGMQDELGEINDAAVARELVAELRERVPQESALLGFIEGVLAERAVQALPRARKHVQRNLRERAGF
ncbi:CYTH and CHAD domain-containing protein [Massilia sp. 9096]|uniref:CYTH and CHAD domain-containing protein n=1 Tax=Massilia sp. 9096 TaxID=1500894 RepID=UPI000562DA53|nr:CYTH and CHAD domain-containing protein [Massilia sp. 9096]